MTSTTFVDLVGPPVNADWLNDVNLKTYFDPQFLSLAAAGGAASVGFQQAGAGAGLRTLQAKGQESLSALDFYANGVSGAMVDPTGVLDSHLGVQAAIDAIVASGTPNQLILLGKLKCSAGLTLPVGFVQLVGHAATLDFSSAPTGTVGITFTGGNVTPYVNANKYINGVELIGPGQATTSTAFYFNTVAEPGPSHDLLQSCNVHGWGKGYTLGNNAYLLDFIHVDFWNCGLIADLPAGTANSGSIVNHFGGTWYNSDNGLNLANTTADVHLFGTALGQIGTGVAGAGVDFTVSGGALMLHGVHVEGTAKEKLLYVPVGAVSPVINMQGCVVSNGASLGAVPFVHAVGDCSITMTEGQYYYTAGTVTAASTGANGTFIQTAVKEVLNGAVKTLGNSYYILATGYGQGPITNMAFLTSNKTTMQSSASVAVAALNTWTNLGVGPISGLFTFRDNTLGGTAAFIADTNVVTSVANGISGGFALRWDGGSNDFQIQYTAFAAARTFQIAVLRMN